MKRLYSYTLQAFIPTFIMTFSICLFIVLMQFLWRFVSQLVGKGIDLIVLAELFLYAALTLVPMALPLGILLASLMTFGNMGEKLELLAIKASGISLLRTMLPLIIFISGISIGMFFFQNNLMPRVETKFRALFLSIKYKSPELDIPEGTFYNSIEGYNLYVKHKDEQTHTLHGVMIYSTSGGLDNMAVIVADSAKMLVSSHKDYLKLTLFNGQQYSNFKQRAGQNRNKGVPPYARENFLVKEIVIPFDANFNRIDETSMSNSHISKNITSLKNDIDSMKHEIDSLNAIDRENLLSSFSVFRGHAKEPINTSSSLSDKTKEGSVKPQKQELYLSQIQPISPDTILTKLPWSEQQSILEVALSQSDGVKYSNQTFFKTDTQQRIRYFQVEYYRKFAISMACLAFFFIGAPLGAIIRKGGLGMPVVISVILFIIYYIVTNIGNKMARDGVLDAWVGMFLSLFVMIPLGTFLTVKANNDSALFNADGYYAFFKMILARNDKRHFEQKQVVINPPQSNKAIQDIESLISYAEEIKAKLKTRNYFSFWLKPDWRNNLDDFSMKLETLVSYLSQSKNSVVLQLLSTLPVFTFWVLPPFRSRFWGVIFGSIFILGVPLYAWISIRNKMVTNRIKNLEKQLTILKSELQKGS